MTPLTNWIAMNALIWSAMLLSTSLLIGDLAWQRNARWHRKAIADGRERTIMRRHAGLLLILAMALLFTALAFGVSASQPGALARFDTDLAMSLHAYVPLPVSHAFARITQLGGILFVASCAAVVALALFINRQRQLAAIWVTTMLAIIPINSGLKAIFHRARPLNNDGLIVEHSWSFPSGHAFGAIVFYGMLAYVLLRLLPRRFHRGVIAAAVLLISTIGISRIMLQVHYFSDVVAGYASGAAWLLTCISIAEYLHADLRRSATATTSTSGDQSLE